MGSVFTGTTSQWMLLQHSCTALRGLRLDVSLQVDVVERKAVVRVFERDHKEVFVEESFEYHEIDSASDWLAKQAHAYRTWR